MFKINLCSVVKTFPYESPENRHRFNTCNAAGNNTH